MMAVTLNDKRFAAFSFFFSLVSFLEIILSFFLFLLSFFFPFLFILSVLYKQKN